MSAKAWMVTVLLAAGPFTTAGVKVEVEAKGLGDGEIARWRAACEDVAARLEITGRWAVRVRRAASLADFSARTGRARFEAAAVVQDTIWVQPAHVFERIPAAAGVRRHECVHLALRRLGVPPLPPALEEAVAVGVSGQAARLPAGRRLDAAGLRRANAALERPKRASDLQSNLRDAVSTLWPRLRSSTPRGLVERLRALAKAPDWTRHPTLESRPAPAAKPQLD